MEVNRLSGIVPLRPAETILQNLSNILEAVKAAFENYTILYENVAHKFTNYVDLTKNISEYLNEIYRNMSENFSHST